MNPTLMGAICHKRSYTPSPSRVYTLSDVPYPGIPTTTLTPNGLKHPRGNNITFIFGHQIALRALNDLTQRMANEDKVVIPVSVELESGLGPNTYYKSSNLASSHVLHMDRLSFSLRRIIVDYLEKAATKEGHPFPRSLKRRSSDELDIIMYRPHLIGKLHALEEFSHLDVITYPVMVGNSLTKRATLFYRDGVARIYSPTHPELTFELPKKLPCISSTTNTNQQAGLINHHTL